MGLPVIAAWAASDDGGSGSQTFTATAPSGIVAGNLLLILCMADAADDIDVMSINGTTYPGWTKVGESGDNLSDVHTAVWWKEAGGSEGDVVIDDDDTNNHVAWYMRITGADTTTPIHKSAQGQSSSDASSFNMASFTTTIDNCLGVAIAGWNGADLTPHTMTGSGWSETDEQAAGSSSTSCAGNFGEADLGTGGSKTGPTAGAAGSDGWAYFKLAIAPGGPAIDNLSGVPGGDIVQISDVDVGDIDNMSGVTF